MDSPTLQLLHKFNFTYYGLQPSKTSAPIFSTTHKADLFMAAFIHGCATHVFDFEPMWHPPTHPISPVLPALISLTYSSTISGQEFLLSFAVALEMESRLILLRKDSDVPLIYHPPGVEGSMAVTLGCAKLSKMNLLKTCYALYICASRSSGIMANVGTMTKCMQAVILLEWD